MEQDRQPWNRTGSHGTGQAAMEQDRQPWNRTGSHGTGQAAMEQDRQPLRELMNSSITQSSFEALFQQRGYRRSKASGDSDCGVGRFDPVCRSTPRPRSGTGSIVLRSRCLDTTHGQDKTNMTAWHGRIATVALLLLYAALAHAGDDGSCTSTPLPKRITAERSLMHCLMKSYNQDVRPAHSNTDKVEVHFEMKSIHILEMNTKTSLMRATAWLEESWIDPQLTWNKSDYEDIDTIRIPAKKLWIPDIVQYHNVDPRGLYVTDVLVVVNSNGTVTWSPHALLSTACYAHMRHFPFDHHECALVFGSWTYDNSQLIVKLRNAETIPTLSYQDDSWHITTTSAHEFPVDSLNEDEENMCSDWLILQDEENMCSDWLILHDEENMCSDWLILHDEENMCSDWLILHDEENMCSDWLILHDEENMCSDWLILHDAVEL
ncbi:hypothetical protein LSAT2_001725 [Lamellibrachia satsuma]|nr:hypothetical protein LSAT2_001725 [Lamellibrachia satsuma]